jgi:hypothetical protein
MQYCGAAPASRFVPYSESVLSRCANGFRYCERWRIRISTRRRWKAL